MSQIDFKERKTKLIDLIHESKDLTENSKKILMDFVALFLKCLNNTTISEIKNLINSHKQPDKQFFLSLLDADEQRAYEENHVNAVMAMLKFLYIAKLQKKNEIRK